MKIAKAKETGDRQLDYRCEYLVQDKSSSCWEECGRYGAAWAFQGDRAEFRPEFIDELTSQMLHSFRTLPVVY